MKRVIFFSSLLFILGLFLAGGQKSWGESRILPDESQEKGMIDSSEMALLVQDHLQKMIQDPKKEVEIREFRPSGGVPVPKGEISYEILLPERAVRGGNVVGTLTLLSLGHEIKKVRFSARVEVYADVLVASRYLKRNQAIQPEDFQWAKKNIALLPQDILTEEKELLGKRTTQSINPQEPLRTCMVETPPLVQKGDRVVLVVENEQFKITTLGEVKESGRKGERIKLVNLASKKEVYGRVVDGNTALIDY